MTLTRIASGKVRDIYELDEESLLLVTSDRISAFDVIMEEPVPDRGRALTGLTEFWLRNVAGHLPNHLVSVDVPPAAADLEDTVGRSMVVRKAEMVPLEFVVRGYLAGSGWKEYQTAGTLHGRRLPKGLQLGSRLPEPLLTPSTKGELGQHDINLSYEEAQDLIGSERLRAGEELALELYSIGSDVCAKAGFILADTKFELGYIDGTLSLCDEILTPDSSRYWPMTGWEPGENPPAFDKQVLRDWLETLDWNKEPPPPHLPDEVVHLVRDRYVEAYERITGRRFTDWPGVSSGAPYRRGL